MKQYFFDLVSDEKTFHDFQGRQFQTDWDAGQHAKMLAIHAQYDPGSARADWTIMVRDAPGQVVHAERVPRCAVAGKAARFFPDYCGFGELMAAAA